MSSIETKAYNSAYTIYLKFGSKYNKGALHLQRRYIKYNGMKLYYYDSDHIVSNSGQPVIAYCEREARAYGEDFPNDEFLMYDHKSIIAWRRNSDVDLFRLPSYNDYDLFDIYWCKKFGFMRRVQSTYYEILEVYTDDGRPSDFVYVNSTRRHILKIYLKEFERKYKKTLIKV